MQIRTKIFLAFLSLALLPLATVSLVAYTQARRTLTESELQHLYSVASIQKQRIESVLKSQQQRLDLVVHRPYLLRVFAQFLHDPQLEYQEQMQQILQGVQASNTDVRTIALFTPDARLVTATDPARLAASDSDVLRGQERASIPRLFLDAYDQVSMVVSAPMYLENTLLGQLVIEADTTSLVDIVDDYAGLGTTGETMLAQRDAAGNARFLTPTRFDSHAALRRTISQQDHQNAMIQAFQNPEQRTASAIDYRDVSILAATAYLPVPGWGIVVKIDQAEAFVPVHRLGRLVSLIFGLTCLGVMASAYLLTRRITRPILRLTRVAESIEHGDLTQRVDDISPDEIGVLARTFNRMTSDLITANSTLEQRVQERTAALEQESIERQKIEVILRESEERLRQLAEHIDQVIWLTDAKETHVLYVSPAYERMWGRSCESLYAQPHSHLDAVHAEDRDRVQAAQAQKCTGDYALEYRIERPDGVLRWVVVRAFPIRNAQGEVYRIAGVVEDITERKRAEASIQRQAHLLEISFDAILVGVLDGAITFWNQGAEELYGFAEDQAIGCVSHDLLKTYHPEGLECIKDTLKCTGSWTGILQHRTCDGRLIEVESRQRLVRESDGRLMVFETNRDITERIQAEGKVQAHLARLELLSQLTRAIGERQDLPSIFQVVIRSLEDHLPVDFSCVGEDDPAGNGLMITSVGLRSAALTRELALTEHARIAIDENGLARCMRGQLVYEPDISHVEFPFTQRLARAGLRALVGVPLRVESTVFGLLVAARRQPHSFSSGECEFLRQVSEHVALAAHQAHLYSALQQAYDDVRQTQQTVMQQERLRALGQMASGIAHDINNALSPVMLYTEGLLEGEPNLSARARARLEIIARAIDDVAETIARLNEFYRQPDTPLVLAPVHVNALVHQVINLTRARWSNMPQQQGVVIHLQTELAPNLPAIRGIESELREALINLVFNAADAMPDGGTLMLRTHLADSAPAAVDAPALQYVHVEVTDTGIGMDEDTQRRCLEPFFTTKGERGTGLGLAMVYGIVQRHGAKVDITSTVGQGTTVRLRFAVPTTPVAGALQPVGTYMVPSRLRILVVDDDPPLLQSLCETLSTDGHVVVAANSGQEGIDAFCAAHARREPFAVVITDLGMPHVDGRHVAHAVKEMSSTTPVILLTGWGQRLVAERDVPPHVDYVLNKPPRLRELREALAHCHPSAEL